jgi:hypothetical protein
VSSISDGHGWSWSVQRGGIRPKCVLIYFDLDWVMCACRHVWWALNRWISREVDCTEGTPLMSDTPSNTMYMYVLNWWSMAESNSLVYRCMYTIFPLFQRAGDNSPANNKKCRYPPLGSCIKRYFLTRYEIVNHLLRLLPSSRVCTTQNPVHLLHTHEQITPLATWSLAPRPLPRSRLRKQEPTRQHID